MKIIRQIDVFDNKTERLVDEILLSDLDLEEVKKIIQPEESDPALYDCYEITGSLKEYFESLGFSFKENKYSYYLCCYQDFE
ncbi:hypothetical protein C8N40_10226 [Pontibacter mucosus]|uniref:DUF7683 domain-containing protein n=1 Tax=Pontibacter mucosus TaxID=1649266 RepID=A0A2T5YNZ0_9BACT|nr:hypothetical protein [Pontibacter mucosus]PTX21057.1 hypothetical protein C8N40_10226 [Pontibacter mucosus]